MRKYIFEAFQVREGGPSSWLFLSQYLKIKIYFEGEINQLGVAAGVIVAPCKRRSTWLSGGHMGQFHLSLSSPSSSLFGFLCSLGLSWAFSSPFWKWFFGFSTLPLICARFLSNVKTEAKKKAEPLGWAEDTTQDNSICVFHSRRRSSDFFEVLVSRGHLLSPYWMVLVSTLLFSSTCGRYHV